MGSTRDNSRAGAQEALRGGHCRKEGQKEGGACLEGASTSQHTALS